jgi:hypothetical protein
MSTIFVRGSNLGGVEVECFDLVDTRHYIKQDVGPSILVVSNITGSHKARDNPPLIAIGSL